jgi:hypothetical protein
MHVQLLTLVAGRGRRGRDYAVVWERGAVARAVREKVVGRVETVTSLVVTAHVAALGVVVEVAPHGEVDHVALAALALVPGDCRKEWVKEWLEPDRFLRTKLAERS